MTIRERLEQIRRLAIEQRHEGIHYHAMIALDALDQSQRAWRDAPEGKQTYRLVPDE